MSDLDSYEEIEIEEEYFTEDEDFKIENVEIQDDHFAADDNYDCDELMAIPPHFEEPKSQPVIETAAVDVVVSPPAREFNIPLLFYNKSEISRPDYGNLAARIRAVERKL